MADSTITALTAASALTGTELFETVQSGSKKATATQIRTFAQSGYTAGSVLFSNGSGIAQDNANLFWDDTNKVLGIGTSTPGNGSKLDIRSDHNLVVDDVIIRNINAGAGAFGSLTLYNDADHYGSVGMASTGVHALGDGLFAGMFLESDYSIGLITDTANQAIFLAPNGIEAARAYNDGTLGKFHVGNDNTFDITFPDYALQVGNLSTPSSAPTGNLSAAQSAWLRANPSADMAGVSFEGIHVQASKQGSHTIDILRGMATYAYLEANSTLTSGIIGQETVAQINSGVSSNVPNLWGGELRSEHNGSGTVAIGAGAYNVYDQLGAGATTLAIGARDYVNCAGGTMTTAIAVEASVFDGGTVTTGYGFKTNTVAGTTAYDFYSTQNAGATKWAFFSNGTARSFMGGNLVVTPEASATALAANGQLTFQATSNTSLTFKYRGSDGTTRSASLTLA